MNEEIYFKEKSITVGIDEACKGEALGPLFIVGVYTDLEDLSKIPLFPDSKKATKTQIDGIFTLLKKYGLNYVVREVEPIVLDNNNLNKIIKDEVVNIIRKISAKKAYVDSHYNNSKNYEALLKVSLPNVKIVTENRLDSSNNLVALASIVAKNLKNNFYKQHLPSAGSGNLNDIRTIKYILANKYSKLVRQKWIRNL